MSQMLLKILLYLSLGNVIKTSNGTSYKYIYIQNTIFVFPLKSFHLAKWINLKFLTTAATEMCAQLLFW